MNNKIQLTLLEEFLNNFNLENISFNDFKNKAVTNRNILIKDWLNDFPEDDIRFQNKDEILNILYDIMVVNAKQNLELWYREHISIDDLNKYMIFNFDKNILNNNTISGKTNNLTRINKNLFWKEVYNTPKIGYNTKPTLLLTIKAMFENYMLPRCCGLPMGIKKLLNNDVKGLYAIIRGTEQKASIFNPYTCGWILENIYKAEKVLTPVMGWNSYLIGFYNTTAKEYVGIDVIPDLMVKAESISSFYKNINVNKKTKFYCCPSETINEQHNFINTYKNYFDSIFFSPPYFELEKYNNGEQSIKSFPNYEDWLKGYWEETCKLCSEVMTDNGHFGFVISNYKNGKKWYNLSDDLLDIAKKYFDLEQSYLLGWNAFKVLDSEKMQKGNFENFYFMKKKGY